MRNRQIAHHLSRESSLQTVRFNLELSKQQQTINNQAFTSKLESANLAQIMLRSVLLSFLLLLQNAKAEYVDLTLEEFAQGVEEGRYKILADVRTSREYENGHIPQSTLLENLASLGNAAQVATPADLAGCEDCPVVVFDSNGARSRVALDFLADAGFNNLYLFEGGVDAWEAQRFDMEEGTNSVTPACTGVETIACSGLSAPTTPPLPSSPPTSLPSLTPTYGRLDESRRVSAEQLVRMKNNGEVGVIMDVREGTCILG